jgi:hypothetical protein
LFDDLNLRFPPSPLQLCAVAFCAPLLLPLVSACCQVYGETALPGRMLYGLVLPLYRKNRQQPSSRRECRYCTVMYIISY